MAETGRWTGSTVVVTGGSSGIGLATAEAFARRGAHVGLIARGRERLEAAREAVHEVRLSDEQRVAVAAADASDEAEARRALSELATAGLEPDVLVNSAGVIIPGEFTTLTREDFAEDMKSFWAVVHTCRAVVPGMRARGAGHIVNVSSVAGFLGIYGYTAYSAAKYAVMGFSEALRFELKPDGISVHVVCPPDTDTPGLAAEKLLRPAETDAIAGNIRPVPPSIVGEAIVRGVERGRYLVIPDLASRFYFRLKGILPELFFSIVDGDVRRARKRT